MPGGIPPSDFPKVDLLNPQEIFADSLGQTILDGNTLRLEFCVIRMDDVPLDSRKKATGKRHVTARIVLNTEGAIELVNRCLRFADVMEQRGLIRRTVQGAPDSAVPSAV